MAAIRRSSSSFTALLVLLVAAVLLCSLLVTPADAGVFGCHRRHHHKRRHHHNKWRKPPAAAGVAVRHRLDEKAAAAGDIVVEARTNVSNHYCRHGLTGGDCTAVLGSDKRSLGAKDAKELRLIAVDQLGASVAAADGRIAAELNKTTTTTSGAGNNTTEKEKEKEEERVRSLQYCRLQYGLMAGLLPMCRSVLDLYDDSSVVRDAWHNYDGGLWGLPMMMSAVSGLWPCDSFSAVFLRIKLLRELNGYIL